MENRLELEEHDVMDSFSRTVTRVVEEVGKSVVGIGSLDSRAVGSGVIIAPDGYILTNHHVVGNGKRFSVTLSDGRVLDAGLVGSDRILDLAVIRAYHGTHLPYSLIGDSSVLRPGQLVIAIGNPLGFQSTVTSGVVSSNIRSWHREGRLVEDIIQHTAPLNPGNSGGPLVDSLGRVVGINTAMIYGAQGIFFAVPSAMIKKALPQILGRGKVARAHVGISVAPVMLEPGLVRALGLGRSLCVAVVAVAPDSPAENAGVEEGDVILSLDGRDVGSIDEVSRFFDEGKIGKNVKMRVFRGGDYVHNVHEFSVVPAEA